MELARQALHDRAAAPDENPAELSPHWWPKGVVPFSRLSQAEIRCRTKGAKAPAPQGARREHTDGRRGARISANKSVHCAHRSLQGTADDWTTVELAQRFATDCRGGGGTVDLQLLQGRGPAGRHNDLEDQRLEPVLEDFSSLSRLRTPACPRKPLAEPCEDRPVSHVRPFARRATSLTLVFKSCAIVPIGGKSGRRDRFGRVDGRSSR